MRSSMFAMLAAAVAVLQVPGVRGEEPEPAFIGLCKQGGFLYDYFEGRDDLIETVATCRDWCVEYQAVFSSEPVPCFSMIESNGLCICHVMPGTLLPNVQAQEVAHYVAHGATGAAEGSFAGARPNGGSGWDGAMCFLTDFDIVCGINVIVGLDQTSRKRGDTSLETFKEKLFELTDEMIIGPSGVWMEVSYLQGHKQNGNKHKKQITTALSLADSMAEVVDPRDFVTETEMIRRPRTPFLSFLGVDVPTFVETIDDAERSTFCLIFTNKGDIARGKEKKEFRKFAKAFKEDPPCVPICYQDSREAGGPSFLARVLCSDELSFYSDTYDAEALKETMCTIPVP